MSDQRETYQRISVPEAARVLGISVATVRRRIRDGSLRAERVERPQGITYAVLLPSDHDDQAERSDSDQQVGTTARLNRSADDQAAAIATLIQATVREAITPLVELVAEQGATIRDQAETIGSLRAERDSARAALAAAEETVMVQLAPEPPPAAPGEPAPAEPTVDTRSRISLPVMRWFAVLIIVAAVLALILVFVPR